ncbi:MAG: translocation/assembly module TamB domain-containing protein [Flavobacteriia bacterium]|nr:translocation/assembly module TamB domain-containing protein [Flavobacteriia bacterium]
MTKIIKIIGRIVGISIEWILIFVLFFAFAIRTSPVQSYLAKIATDFLSKELKTTFRIDQVSIIFLDKVALDGVLVKDQKNDTLAYIPRMYVTLDELNLKDNKVILDKIAIEKGVIKLNRDKKTGDYNYWFITDYFGSSQKKKSGKAIDMHLNEINIEDVSFYYDDNRKYYSSFGLDYDHIHLKHVTINARHITVIDDVIRANITKIAAIDKSGFVLNSFSTYCKISKKGVLMENLSIRTPYSNVIAPKMNLLMNRYQCFYSFEDSVTFDSKIKTSSISLKDISYFATALEGMEQQIEIDAVITKKVRDLKIDKLHFKTGQKTVLQGTLNLPDFRNFSQAFFQEKLDYAYISLADLRKIKMPKDNGGNYLTFDKYIDRLSFFEARNFKLDGFYSQFVVASNQLKTALGSVKFDNGIMFTENRENNSYLFEKSQASDYDVKIENFQLDQFLEDETFGRVDGTVFLSGEIKSLSDIKFNDIEGNIHHLEYLDYVYENVFVEKGKYIDDRIDGIIEVKDNNLNLIFEGFIDLKGEQQMDFTVDLSKALLTKLNITHIDNSNLSSKFRVNLIGNSSSNLRGQIKMEELKYFEQDKIIEIPELTLNIKRALDQDILSINSNILNTTIIGKVDFETVVSEFENQFSKVFPAILKPKENLSNNSKKKNHKKVVKPKNHFEYTIEIKEINDLLAIFIPDLIITKGTRINGSYSEESENFFMKINSQSINYLGLKMSEIDVNQKLTSSGLEATYSIKKFNLNDSIKVENLKFVTIGTKDELNSSLTWNPNTKNDSKISWNTKVLGVNRFNITLSPSYFALKEKKWFTKEQSNITVFENTIDIDNFKLERKQQFISLFGRISNNDNDKLNFKINDLSLSDLSVLLGVPVELEGTMNGWGYLSNPYKNLTYIGDANIQNLYIDKHEVGNIFFQSQWNKASNSFGLTGDLIYKTIETFAFEGNYYLDRKKDNLDFYLDFDKTDIKFTNAFMDPAVMSNVKGLIDGKLQVKGTFDKPEIEGEVKLIDGNAKLDVLGVNFGFNGKISSDKYGFYIDNMPVNDEEGNTGVLNGSIYHNYFFDWNFDLLFNLEDDYYHKDPFFAWKPAPLEKFLVLNTTFKEGDVYYGKGYATGFANIFGYSENIEITVNLKSQKETKIIFPMYSSSVIEEDEDSPITYKLKPEFDTLTVKNDAIDFTGVDLDLNFKVTPDADLRIIFNEKTGDEIKANGEGDIAVKLDNLGDINMEGSFNVKKGLYNFVMGSVRQPLIIQKGSLTWTGDPYNAYIDLHTYFDVKASLDEISKEKINGTNASVSQDIQCYINLSETLFKPAIAFDIIAPKATDEEQSLLNGIKSNPDELNRQFISLLVLRHFQSLQENGGGGVNTALDIAANQINAILSQVSKEYKLKLDLDADANGDKTVALDVSKQFLDNRLILTGSFGVENSTTTTKSTTQSSLIGDVSLEYLLNESGTFRINVFNESNDNTIIQQKSLGLFTQGAGLHYQEDFNDLNSFKLIQYTFDLFRQKEKKKYPNKKKRKQTPIPVDTPISSLFIKPDSDYFV